MKLAFLFPGQGSQKPNMLHNLPMHAAVSEVIKEANEVLDENIYNFQSESALSSTIAVQVSLLVSGVATYKAFESDDLIPHYVAGHSVGAFSAAVAAKVIDFPEALRLVKLRGELMEQAYPVGYGMGVVVGIKLPRLREIINTFSSKNTPVYVANHNAPDQFTISGALPGIKKVMEFVKENGARRAEVLQVSVPSHCELMKKVAEEFFDELRKIKFRNPSIPFVGNRTARILYQAEDVQRDLAESISSPVRWYEATSVLYEMGVRMFIEMHPGNVLTNLARKEFPDSRAFSVCENGYRNCKYSAEHILH